MATVEVSLARTAEARAVARTIEASVFNTWYGNTSEQLSAEYDRYEAASVFLLAHQDGDAVAMMRLVGPSPAGLKTLVDIAGPPWSADVEQVVAAVGMDLSRTWDVATSAALPQARAGRSSAALYKAAFMTLLDVGAQGWTAVVDCRVLRLLRAGSVAVDALPGLASAPYLGSPASVPVYGHLTDSAAVLDRSDVTPVLVP